jgi:hypothetical protein
MARGSMRQRRKGIRQLRVHVGVDPTIRNQRWLAKTVWRLD